MKRHIIQNGLAVSCYFRSSVEPPYRKALLQITERCNLFCAHCFVSAGDFGDTMSLEVIRDIVIPRIKQCRVISITLTGGEPFAHPDIVEIVQLLRIADIQVSICSNATIIGLDQIQALSELGNVHINVSLDGFAPESHGKFRGDKKSFYTTIETVKILSQYDLLQGLLVTPNNLARIEEYTELCEFAVENRAKYVLMNPLSKFGRGTRSQRKLAASEDAMERIREVTSQFKDQIELVNIRFPNKELPLASCEAGNIIYVFVNGEVTVCPYLIFAAKTPDSKHKPDEFVVGNILSDTDIADRLDNYRLHERYDLGGNTHCRSCAMESGCGKGCPAAIIASGQRIEGVDVEQCPIVNIVDIAGGLKTGGT